VALIAPTGSGKTEAALCWAQRRRAARDWSPRLFYVLPYQASIDAMYRRLQARLGTEVALVHSRAVRHLYRWLLDDEQAPATARARARRHRAVARLHGPPARVTTPYQLLRGLFGAGAPSRSSLTPRDPSSCSTSCTPTSRRGSA
ncbi:MAG: DEAD/DEAH box helicase, partial [Egibacteraceae bacterium]